MLKKTFVAKTKVGVPVQGQPSATALSGDPGSKPFPEQFKLPSPLPRPWAWLNRALHSCYFSLKSLERTWTRPGEKQKKNLGSAGWETHFLPTSRNPYPRCIPVPLTSPAVGSNQPGSKAALTSGGWGAADARRQKSARVGCASCYFYLIMPRGSCYFPLFLSRGNCTAKVCSLVLAFSANAWNAFFFFFSSICSQKWSFSVNGTYQLSTLPVP